MVIKLLIISEHRTRLNIFHLVNTKAVFIAIFDQLLSMVKRRSAKIAAKNYPLKLIYPMTYTLEFNKSMTAIGDSSFKSI